MYVCVLQLDLTFHLFVCALAGAGAAVIAMVRAFILMSHWLEVRDWHSTCGLQEDKYISSLFNNNNNAFGCVFCTSPSVLRSQGHHTS